MITRKPSAAQLLDELKRETQLVVWDGQNFILRPQPENPWQYQIAGTASDNGDAVVGWVSLLLGMSWAHPVLIRQYVRLACQIFAIDISANL
ncbi:hypothetical protein KCT17_003677 [Escherichia coli]|nr:hypothetical protein [Escherichia coli]